MLGRSNGTLKLWEPLAGAFRTLVLPNFVDEEEALRVTDPPASDPYAPTFILAGNNLVIRSWTDADGVPSPFPIHTTLGAGDLLAAGSPYSNLSLKDISNNGLIVATADKTGDSLTHAVLLLPVEFEIIHTEKVRDIDGNESEAIVSPGKDTLLRDEIAELRIKVPPIGTADWDMKLDVETPAALEENLGTRSNVQMYDFGKIAQDGTITPLTTEANGATKAGPYDLKMPAATQGETKIKLAINKEGKFKLRLKTADNKVEVISQEFTVMKRIRKYGKDNATTTYDFNKHDQHFINASDYWGAFYVHPVDDVERLKAMGMTESELGRNPTAPIDRPQDIMTVGNPGDHVLDKLHHVAGHHESEVDPQNNVIRDLNYPRAAASPAGTAIVWGTCWLYHKAQIIANNPQPPPDFIPGGWRTWDNATSLYNGGGII